MYTDFNKKILEIWQTHVKTMLGNDLQQVKELVDRVGGSLQDKHQAAQGKRFPNSTLKYLIARQNIQLQDKHQAVPILHFKT